MGAAFNAVRASVLRLPDLEETDVNVFDYILIAVIAVCIAAVVVFMIKRRKKGGCGCGCGCTGCPYSDSCEETKQADNEKP